MVGALVVATLPVAAATTAAAAPDDPVLTWARSATAFGAASVGRSVAVDGLGNTLVTGSFEDRATFGEGDRAVELISLGFEDIFVAKYDPDGQLVWAQSAGSTSFDEGFAIDTDAADNVYVSGEVWSNAEFGTDPVTVGLPAGAFLAKFAPDGSLTWVRGEAGLFGVGDLAVDSVGNTYVTGSLSRTIAFGDGDDEVTLSPRSSAADVFLAAYGPDGGLAWVRDAGGLDQDRALGVDVNNAGNVVISGSFTGPTTFGTGPAAVTLPAAGDPGAFVAMYSASGDFAWVRAVESTFAEARDVAVDGSGRASIVGRFSDFVSFAADGGPITLTAPQFTLGVFLATFAADGTIAWATAGTTENGFPDGWSVAVDGTRVVIGGEFSGESITFGNGADAVTLDNVNSSPDVFVASFTAGGLLSWARAAGGAFSDAAHGVALGADSVSFTGQYQFTATFGSGADQVILGSEGSLAEPAFVARYSTASAAAPARIVIPSQIAGTGTATVRVVGAGLVAGTTFDLLGPGGQVLVPTMLDVKASGQEVEGRFELLDAALGPWTVRLTVPGEGETRYPGAITVVEPGGNDDNPLWLSLSVRDTVRAGRPFVTTLSVGNRTDRDLAGVPLVLEGLPPGTEVTPLWDDIERPTDPLPGMPPPGAPSEIPPTFEDDDGTLTMPILTGRIPANGRTDLPVEITFPPGTNIPVDMTLGGCQPTWEGNSLDPSPGAGIDVKNCVQALMEEVLSEALGFLPGGNCVQDGFAAYTTHQVAGIGLDALLEEAFEAGSGSAMTGNEVMETIGDLLISCTLDVIPQTKLIRALKDIWELVQDIESRIETINACLPPLPPSKRQIGVVNSVDPNDKVGPDGVGDEGFTTPDVPFDYTVYFENVATATAPAQRVVVSDVIDTTTFDPATIELGAITLGSSIVAVPPAGLREWSDVVEYGDPDLLLGIDASWDEATSTLTWTLETLDRTTQLPTDDPLAGFLPPNVEAPEGEGSVRFLIEPRLRTDGMVLTNEATIVFDANEPIATGPWTNTLDGTAPTSAIAPLTESTDSASVPVSWAASDALSGVGLVEIWVQRDDGPAELWRIATDPAVTTDTFEGTDGSTYAFWTRAWDRAGNIEPPPGPPDAITRIRLNDADDGGGGGGTGGGPAGGGGKEENPTPRIAGADRIETAIRASLSSFTAGDSAEAVVLARSDDFADALAGTPLAVAKNAPLLLTPGTNLEPRTRAEIERVLTKGATVHLLGGDAALSAGVASELLELGYNVVRYAGNDRYETAVRIASEGLGDPATILLATGSNFPDGLSAGSAAAHASGAVLLTAGTDLPAPTEEYLASHSDVAVTAIGGPAATAVPTADAIVGEDRYETAVAVAGAFFDSPEAVGVASGENFPDALSGSAHIGRLGGPLLLAHSGLLPSVVQAYMMENGEPIGTAFVYGGSAAIVEPVRTAIARAIHSTSAAGRS